MTRPEASVSRPPRILISVVLPEPDGPMSATHSPRSMRKLSASTARSEPYFLVSDSMITCACAITGACVLTLHLETRMQGARSRASAADTRLQSKPVWLAPQLQDTQSSAAVPLRRTPACPARWKAAGPARRRAYLPQGREEPPPQERGEAPGA